MAKPTSGALRARLYHRYLGFFLSGIMAVYAISGVALIFRKGDTFKRTRQIEQTLAAGLGAAQIGEALDIRTPKLLTEDQTTLTFENGVYNSATGDARFQIKEYPLVLDKMMHLHKATTNDPLYWLNIFFGCALLFFVGSAFWMYLPGGPVLRKGLWFAAGGVVLTLVLLFL